MAGIFNSAIFNNAIFNIGTVGVEVTTPSGVRKGRKQKVIRLAEADRETTAQFLKEQLRLRQGFPEPLKEIREKEARRVIVAQNKREAKMRKDYEEAQAREKAEVLKMNNAILQLIAIAYDA